MLSDTILEQMESVLRQGKCHPQAGLAVTAPCTSMKVRGQQQPECSTLIPTRPSTLVCVGAPVRALG